MFNTMKQRFKDVSTIQALCTRAEKLAHADGQKEPGAEHFVLSALELPDGTARKAFERINADPDRFRTAVTQQYADALQHIGVTLSSEAVMADQETPMAAGTGLYKAQASAETLMQTLARDVMDKEHTRHPETLLLGAHVILAATTAQYGVVVRALRAMGIDPKKLAEAATAEIHASRTV